jgi:hypothetical protein
LPKWVKPVGVGLGAAGLFCLVSSAFTWDGPCGHHSPPPVDVNVDHEIIIHAQFYRGGVRVSIPIR